MKFINLIFRRIIWLLINTAFIVKLKKNLFPLLLFSFFFFPYSILLCFEMQHISSENLSVLLLSLPMYVHTGS